MNQLKHKIIVSLAVWSAVTAYASPQTMTTVRELGDSSSVSSTIYPESFEADTHRMLENWYLRNYAELDKDADRKSSTYASDDEIIERLGAMPTIIEMPFNSIVRNYIDLYTERRKQLVENMLGLSLYYMPIFEQALDRHGLPMELKYLPVIESALNPVAVSRVGATGLWQFMLPTATGLGLEVNSVVDQRRDPYASSEAAAVYLKQLHDMFDDWSLAIAAYNCGPGNVNKALRRAGGGKKDFWELYPFLPAETRGYVPAFIAATYVMNHYGKHNISPALARRPIVTDTVHVNRRVHFDQISDVLAIPVDELRALNPQYRKDLIPGNIKSYALVLPSMQVYAYLANEDSIVNHNADRYSRRSVVEPADGNISGSDDKGEYIDELTVKYHTVKKGETLTSIAKKYGVTVSSLRQSNKIGKNARAGQRLKINTYKRRYKEVVAVPTDSAATNIPVMADSLATNVDFAADSTMTAPRPEMVVEIQNADTTETQVVSKQPSKTEPVKKTEPAKKKSPTIHKVKSGDNLSKIAKRYGVSIAAIKKANNLTSDNITIGQRLTIPVK